MRNIAVALIGLLGVVLGISSSAFRQWTEREDRYRMMTFEKRLAVHQEAFMLVHRLSLEFNGMVSGKGIPDKAAFRSYHNELIGWWETNSLYLDTASRKALLDLMLNVGQRFVAGYNPQDIEKRDEDAKECYDLTKTAMKRIVEGVGQEYLPDVEPLGIGPPGKPGE